MPATFQKQHRCWTPQRKPTEKRFVIPSCAQIILITPQDIAAVEEAKKMLAANENLESIDKRFVHVVRMQPAREDAARS